MLHSFRNRVKKFMTFQHDKSGRIFGISAIILILASPHVSWVLYSYRCEHWINPTKLSTARLHVLLAVYVILVILYLLLLVIDKNTKAK